MPVLHKQLAAGRWFALTFEEQLANVGSDVERTIKAAEAGDRDKQQRAFARALELLGLTLADPRHPERRQELLRLREILCDVLQGENVSGATSAWLREYFLEWGMKARAGR